MSKKITALRMRGVPNVLGGVEIHRQNLYLAIKQQLDVDVCVVARSPYVNYRRSVYRKIETHVLWVPEKRSLEATVHFVIAASRTRIDHSGIVCVRAIGPGLVIPLLRVMDERVVFTHYGPDYSRQKWGHVAKKILLLGERRAMRCANEVAMISEIIN